jgi:hypothetical protein
MTQKQPLENIKEKNVHSVSIFGMKFAIIYLQLATTFLENGFKYSIFISMNNIYSRNLVLS